MVLADVVQQSLLGKERFLHLARRIDFRLQAHSVLQAFKKQAVFQMGAHPDQKLARADRFVQHIGGAGFINIIPVTGRAEGRLDQYRYGRVLRVGPQMAEKFQPIHFGHHNVKDDDVWIKAGQLFQTWTPPSTGKFWLI